MTKKEKYRRFGRVICETHPEKESYSLWLYDKENPERIPTWLMVRSMGEQLTFSANGVPGTTSVYVDKPVKAYEYYRPMDLSTDSPTWLIIDVPRGWTALYEECNVYDDGLLEVTFRKK